MSEFKPAIDVAKETLLYDRSFGGPNPGLVTRERLAVLNNVDRRLRERWGDEPWVAALVCAVEVAITKAGQAESEEPKR